MLLLKRLGTAIGFTLGLYVLFFTFATGVMGGIAGAQISARRQAERRADGDTSISVDFRESERLGFKAGVEMRRKYGPTIQKVSVSCAAVVSLAISFTGLLPWCRRKPAPPPLPV
jgi:hypothetical protein